MALDTRSKRASAVAYAVAWAMALPAPDGTIAAGDRQHLAAGYARDAASVLPTLVQTATPAGGTAVSSVDLVFASNVTAQNRLVVTLTQGSASARTYSVTLQSGTCTIDTPSTRVIGNSGDRLAVIIDVLVTGTGSCTLRVANDNASAQNIRGIAYEFTPCSYDASSSAGTTAVTSHPTAVSGALDTVANVAVVACAAMNSNDSVTLSFAGSPSGYTAGTATTRHISGTKISAPALTDEAPTISSTSSLSASGACASYMGTGSGLPHGVGTATALANASGIGSSIATTVGTSAALGAAAGVGFSFGSSESVGSSTAVATAAAEGYTITSGTAPTIVQTTPSGGGTSQPTADLTFASNVTSGNVLIVSLTQASTSARTWTVAQLSGTATLGTTVTRITSSSADRKAVLFEIPVTGSGSCVLRVSNDNGSSQNIRAIAYEFSACVYDASSNNATIASATSHVISATGALDTSGGVLLVAALCVSANDSSTLAFAASPSGWTASAANSRHIVGTKSSSAALIDEAPLVTSITSLTSVGAIGAWRGASSTSTATGSASAVASATAVGEFVAGRRGRLMWAELQAPSPTDNWLEVSWVQLTIPTAMKGRCHWLQLFKETDGIGRVYLLQLVAPARSRWTQLFGESPTSRQSGRLDSEV